ncbi:MAG: Fic family protein, partial [Dermatophilaceae bacterium]
MSETPGRYEPFPGFVGWCDDYDLSVVDRYARLLEESRDEASPETMERAVRVATRYAAVDTGAIEGLYTTNRGFTRTIAEQTATWEAALAQHGEHVERSINDALAGYELVLDLVTGAQPITEAWIRHLHEVICKSQETYEVFTAVGPQKQPLPKGAYKTMPNNPTSADTGRVFHYAPPDDTSLEMARLVAELQTPAFVNAHPVVQSAYAHYAFVRIHPFADGNGRVARALASVFTYRRPGVPLVVFADQKDIYIDALEAADGERPEAFVAFVGERCMDTIRLVRSSLGVTGAAATAARSLAENLTGRGGLSHQDYDNLNSRIMGMVTERLEALVAEHDLPEGMRLQIDDFDTRASPPGGYRSAGATIRGYDLLLFTPHAVQRHGTLAVWPAKPATVGADFVGTSSATPHRHLEVSLRDIHPTETELLRIEID